MLWSAEGSPTHFVGSFHLLGEVEGRLQAAASDLIAAAEVVVFEADTSHIPANWGELEPGRTLAPALGPDLWGAVSNLAGALGVDLDFLNTREPWAAAQCLSAALLRDIAIDAAFGIDHVLREGAEALGKRVVYLETADDQRYAFSNAPLAEQIGTIRLLVEQPHLPAQDFRRLHAAWRASDLDALNAFHHERATRFPRTFASMVDIRNRRWLPMLAELARRRIPAVVVVGVLHFCGSSSLPALLGQELIQLRLWPNEPGTSLTP